MLQSNLFLENCNFSQLVQPIFKAALANPRQAVSPGSKTKTEYGKVSHISAGLLTTIVGRLRTFEEATIPADV